MRVCLINPAYEYPYANKINVNLVFPNRVVPPLDLAYPAAILEKEGHAVSIIDANAERLSLDELKKKVTESSADLIVISSAPFDRWQCPYLDIKPVEDTIRLFKSVCLMGPHPTTEPEYFFSKFPQVKYIVRNEPEMTIKELVVALNTGKRVDNIKGLSFRGKKIRHNPERPLIRDINSLPCPAYHLLRMELYGDAMLKSTPFVRLLSSRGCPFRCTFCYKSFYGSGYRYRKPSSVFEELKMLKEEYGLKSFYFGDLEFVLNKKRAIEICHLIAPLKLRWGCTCRVTSVDEELLGKMKSAGCEYIYYGLESGDQRVLDMTKKGITLKQAKNAFKITKNSGITPYAFFLLGLPGETMGSIENSIAFLAETEIAESFGFTLAIPYPNTQLYLLAQKENKAKRPWWEGAREYAGLVGNDLDKGFMHSMDLDAYLRRSLYEKKYGKLFYLNPILISKVLRETLRRPHSFVRIVRKGLHVVLK
ncbi:MAG: radical SAM protein [archaeon]